MWNKPSNNWTPRTTQGQEAIVDDRSVVGEETNLDQGSTMTPQQMASTWLQGVANKGEEVRDLIMRDLLGQEDFPNA